MAFSPMHLGLQNAVPTVSRGGDFAGVRYVRGETPLPLIVSKVRIGQATATLTEAVGVASRSLKTPPWPIALHHGARGG
jgi:hypothetical protein